jgi:hypothetical protein
MALAGTSIATTISIASLSSVFIDLRQVLTATQTITGGASAVTVTFHIAGAEIS